jgi:hypothetical protein
VVEHLFSKCKALSSNPNTTEKRKFPNGKSIKPKYKLSEHKVLGDGIDFMPLNLDLLLQRIFSDKMKLTFVNETFKSQQIEL